MASESGVTLSISGSSISSVSIGSAGILTFHHCVDWCRGHTKDDDDFASALRGYCRWGHLFRMLELPPIVGPEYEMYRAQAEREATVFLDESINA